MMVKEIKVYKTEKSKIRSKAVKVKRNLQQNLFTFRFILCERAEYK